MNMLPSWARRAVTVFEIDRCTIGSLGLAFGRNVGVPRCGIGAN